jgi:hypothetical protein
MDYASHIVTKLTFPYAHCFSAYRGRGEKPMTIETAVVVFAAGIIVVALLIWYTYRLTNRRLAKIQSDLEQIPA